MSDRSDLSVPDDDDDPQLDQEFPDDEDDDLRADQDHNGVDDSTSGSDSSEDVESADVDCAPTKKVKDIDVSKLVLCPKHKSGYMVPESCDVCASNLSFINNQDVVKKLMAKTASSLVSKYSGRCDVVEPTLQLSDDTIQLALGIYTKGVFKDTRQWVEVIRKHLTISADKHEMLNVDIQYEDVLNKFKKEPRFNGIFRVASDLAKCIKNLRISTRPLLSLMEEVNGDMEKARAIGLNNGIVFPDIESAPARTGSNVPRNGRTLRDSLFYSKEDAQDLFRDSIPDLSEFYEKLSRDSAIKLHDVFEAFRSSVGEQFLKLFDLIASILNLSEDKLIFFAE